MNTETNHDLQEVIPQLRNLGISITNRCNLVCSYCSRTSSPLDRTELSVSEIKQVILDALKVSAPPLSVAITGGEPVLHTQFKELLDSIKSLPVNLSMNSNGLLLRGMIVDQCLERNIRSFTISLEGTEEAYIQLYGDQGRKKFRHLARNLQELKDRAAHFWVNLTVTPQNIRYAPATVSLARALGASGISLSRVYPIGRAIRGFRTMYVEWGRWLELVREIVRVDRGSFRVLVEDNVLRHLWDPEYDREIRKASEERRIWGGYLSGVSYAQVLADGEVLPDPYLALAAGNVRRQSFDSIWKQSPLLVSLRTRRHLRGACGRCPDKYLCGGHRGRAFAISGDYLAEDPFCPKSQFEQDWKGSAQTQDPRGGPPSSGPLYALMTQMVSQARRNPAPLLSEWRKL